MSVLSDLIILADSLSTSLLSIALKAGELMLRLLWGAIAQWSEHLSLKQEALGSIPGSYPVFFVLFCFVLFFFSSSWLTNVDEDEGSVVL